MRGAWLAFACAIFSFFCCVRSIGLLPTWFLFAWWSGQGRRLFSWSLAMSAALYFACSVPWVAFVSRFAHYEVMCDGKDNLILSLGTNLTYFWVCLPPLLACGSTLPTSLGAVAWIRSWGEIPCGTLLAFLAGWLHDVQNRDAHW